MSKITNDGWLNLAWHRMLYSCAHMAVLDVNGLTTLHRTTLVTDLFTQCETV